MVEKFQQQSNYKDLVFMPARSPSKRLKKNNWKKREFLIVRHKSNAENVFSSFRNAIQCRDRLLYYPGYIQFLMIFEPMFEVYKNGTFQELNKMNSDNLINAHIYYPVTRIQLLISHILCITFTIIKHRNIQENLINLIYVPIVLKWQSFYEYRVYV